MEGISASSLQQVWKFMKKILRITGATVAQCLWRSAADPKDVGSIPAAAVKFRWRRNPRGSCSVLCQCTLKNFRWLKLTGALHHGVPQSLSPLRGIKPQIWNQSHVTQVCMGLLYRKLDMFGISMQKYMVPKDFIIICVTALIMFWRPSCPSSF